MKPRLKGFGLWRIWENYTFFSGPGISGTRNYKLFFGKICFSEITFARVGIGLGITLVEGGPSGGAPFGPGPTG